MRDCPPRCGTAGAPRRTRRMSEPSADSGAGPARERRGSAAAAFRWCVPRCPAVPARVRCGPDQQSRAASGAAHLVAAACCGTSQNAALAFPAPAAGKGTISAARKRQAGRAQRHSVASACPGEFARSRSAAGSGALLLNSVGVGVHDGAVPPHIPQLPVLGPCGLVAVSRLVFRARHRAHPGQAQGPARGPEYKIPLDTSGFCVPARGSWRGWVIAPPAIRGASGRRGLEGHCNSAPEALPACHYGCRIVLGVAC